MTAWAVFFSIAMLLNKKAADHIPTTVILWGRCAFALMFFLPFLKFQSLGHLWGLQVLRGIFISLAMMCTYTAYRHIELHNASILGSTTPFFVTLFSLLFLKERIKSIQWVLLLLGYAGVLVIVGPVSKGVNWFYLIALLGTIFGALAITCARTLAVKKASAQNIIFYGSGIPLLVFSIALLGMSCAPFLVASSASFCQLKPLSLENWGILGAIGFFGGASQWCYFQSLRSSPASFVAPLEYLRLCILIPMGYVLFGEVPARSFYLGSLLILIASVVLIRIGKQRKKAEQE